LFHPTFRNIALNPSTLLAPSLKPMSAQRRAQFARMTSRRAHRRQ
jgi:hypothetical protein